MKNFIFTTKNYDEEALHYSVVEEIRKLKEKMESSPDYEPDHYDRFPGNYMKVRYSNLRLVLVRKDKRINGEDVRIYVALRVFKRGDNEYSRFKWPSTPENERDKITGKFSLDWDYYVRQVEEKLTKPVEDVIMRPELSNAEYQFISTPLSINHQLFDVVIYETKNWIDNVQQEDFTDFSNAALKIEDFIIENLNEKDGWYVIEFKNKAILIYRSGQNWILDRILDQRDGDDYGDFKSQKEPKDYKRGYPFDFLKDKDVWRIMEQDKKSNMVLSQQQVEIVSSEIQYPLLLTGRAGSGKSTLLQYLFAEIILRYVNIYKLYDGGLKLPVYLSYSSNLIDDARKLCWTLFEKNNAYLKQLESGGLTYKGDIEPFMNDMFFVFNDLLRLCIDSKFPGEASKRFPTNDMYISFPTFNAMWHKKFGKVRDAAKRYGPSISWHVIRTYIKGWNCNKYMTPKEYAQIGEKNQTVTITTFRIIYEEVWEKWYSKLDGVWDDQDIVRFCLENDLVDDRYSAVFCDESQDFTRVEIDFILKLSSFSNRRLNNVGDIKRVPFVFAGDEFQTLNPTGFSWASLSSYFTQSLCNSTGLSDHMNELSVQEPIELSENFRSTRQVVMLANRIQLLRAGRFGEYSKPQTPHFSEDGNAVFCVSPSNKYIIDKLKEKEVILIIPAADGESVKDYIECSSLKGLIEFDKAGIPQDITILNPTQAKGLEYPNVAIYGFNCDEQYSQLKLEELLKWFTAPHKDAISDIELRYQISNAYVAVTRASSNLYILDDFNENSFWAFAFNHDDPDVDYKIRKLQNMMFSQLSDGRQQFWREEDLGWIEITPEDVDITDENLKYLRSDEHKYDLENRAEALHDAKLMRRAACIHKSAGNKKDEARCKAKAYNFEDDYSQAAEWYKEAEEYEAAVENYWMYLNNTHDKKVISQIAALIDHTQNVKVRICSKCGKPMVRDLKIAIDATLSILSQDQNEQMMTDAWQLVLNMMLQNIQARKREGLQDIPVIVSGFTRLADFEIRLNIDKLALLSYQIGAYEEAIKLWESMDKNSRPKEFFIAKMNILKYPDAIEYYEGTANENWMQNLLRDYRNNSEAKLNDSQKRIIATVVMAIGDKDEFLALLPFMLRSAYNKESSLKVLDDADKFKCNLNKIAINALIETRFTELSEWARPKSRFADREVSTLFSAIEAIKNMRRDGFIAYLNRSLMSQKVIDFAANYNNFSRKKVTKLVLSELGKCFEARETFIDACRFYQWAENQSDDEGFKRMMRTRWIVCKERQADHERDDSKKALLTKDAQNKRRELNISLDEKLPESLSLTPTDWEDLFAFYITISNEVIAESKQNGIKPEVLPESPVIASGASVDTTMADRSKLCKQEVRYGNYAIVFLPGKGDVVIKDTENEYSVRIRGGKFPDGGDFELRGSRIYVADDDSPTPFVLDNAGSFVTIKVYEADVFTGLSVQIDLSE